MKRFTETTKWGDPWYRKLPPRLKSLWQYLTDSCDCAGVIEPDWQVISLQIGDNVSDEDLKAFGDRIVELSSGKLWLTKFMDFQYGELSTECRAHGPVFKAIQKHGLERVSNGYSMGIHTHKEKEKDKDKDKDTKEEECEEKPIPKARASSAKEVSDFCLTVGLTANDGEWFFAGREGKGWKNKGDPIKDWKQTVRAWKAAGHFPSQKNGNEKPTSKFSWTSKTA